MDQKNGIFAQLAAIPILALFLGVAFLAARIAYDWTPELSQTVVGGVLTICAGAVALVGVIFGLLAGIALYKRLNRSREQPEAVPPMRTISGYPVLPYREPGAPQLTDGRQAGSWSSNGPASYDVWEEEPAGWSQDRSRNDWQEGGR